MRARVFLNEAVGQRSLDHQPRRAAYCKSFDSIICSPGLNQSIGIKARGDGDQSYRSIFLLITTLTTRV